MGFQSTGIGRFYSWDRSLAGGLAVLFPGVGFFCGTVGPMATEIGIPFAGVSCVVGLVVWPVKYGYSLLESVLHFVSRVVQPI